MAVPSQPASLGQPSQPACKPTRATADDKARPLLSQRFWSLPPAARIFYQRIPPSPVSACFSLTTYLIHSSHLPPPPVSNTHPAAAPHRPLSSRILLHAFAVAVAVAVAANPSTAVLNSIHQSSKSTCSSNEPNRDQHCAAESTGSELLRHLPRCIIHCLPVSVRIRTQSAVKETGRPAQPIYDFPFGAPEHRIESSPLPSPR